MPVKLPLRYVWETPPLADRNEFNSGFVELNNFPLETKCGIYKKINNTRATGLKLEKRKLLVYYCENANYNRSVTVDFFFPFFGSVVATAFTPEARIFLVTYLPHFAWSSCERELNSDFSFWQLNARWPFLLQ